MLRVSANHAHDPSSLNDLALIANLFDGCFYFHPALPFSIHPHSSLKKAGFILFNPECDPSS